MKAPRAPFTGKRLPNSVLWAVILANFLASFGGGRVISAGKGVTGITFVGSGSILAFLVGSSLGLGLILAVRHARPGRALVGLSAGALLCSLLLRSIVAIYSPSPDRQMTGEIAWLFFFLLCMRCAFWFAGRSLRTNLAVNASRSWLGLAEGTYFVGFIGGLLAGHVFSSWQVSQSLALDIGLLMTVLACDFVHWGKPLLTIASTKESSGGRSALHLVSVSFWALTLCLALVGVAHQAVFFHVADRLARLGLPKTADAVMAAFYAGVASAALWCSSSRPGLSFAGGQVRVSLMVSATPVAISVNRLVLLIAAPAALSVAGLGYIAARTSALTYSLSLLSLGISAFLFEILVLTIVGTVSEQGASAAAVSLGVAASAATLCLFLLLLLEAQVALQITTVVAGFAVAPALIRSGAVTPNAKQNA